jgi:hypothetical protein
LEKQKIARLRQENTRLLSVNEKLKNENLYLLRLLLGRSSERYIKEAPNQLKLDFGGEDTLIQEAQAQLEAARETITCERKKKKKCLAARSSALTGSSGAQRRDHRVRSAARRFKIDGGGSDGSPGIYIRNAVRPPQMVKEEGVVTGELPSLSLPKSSVGAPLLSYLLMSKYQDHLPFYRQIEIFKRQGVKLSPSTVNGGLQLR